MRLLTAGSLVQVQQGEPVATATANIAIYISRLRYFLCPKANSYIVSDKHVAVDSAIHNPLGFPSGFYNRSITASYSLRKFGCALAKKHLLVPRSVFCASLTYHFLVGARLTARRIHGDYFWTDDSPAQRWI